MHEIKPIGFIRSPFTQRYTAPLQAEHDATAECCIELLPHMNFETALRDLEDFSHIHIIWLFHEAVSWKPVIQTPRDGSRHGVFATRSPHRPNPIGMSVVPLVRIAGRVVVFRGADMIDGTPVLDLKPYIPDYDSFPEASAGWTEQIARRDQISISWSPLASSQASFITSNGTISMSPRLTAIA